MLPSPRQGTEEVVLRRCISDPTVAAESDAIGHGRTVARTAVGVDGWSPGQDRVHQADAESGHYGLAQYASTIGSSSSGVAPCMISASAP
jgi:hypothetical protein